MSDNSGSGLRFAARMRLPRAIGLALGFLCVATVFREYGAHPLQWIALAANGFAWPHIAWWIAQRSRDPREAEFRNLVIDSALGAVWIVQMGFSPLPSMLLAVMLSMDKIAAGGARLLGRSLLAMLGAGAAAAAVLGAEFRSETTPLILAGCIPFLVGYPLAVGVTMHRLGRRLRERTRALELQIEEHRRTQAALAQARDRAEQANRAKSEFLSHMSHDLRTPLNAILGFAQLLELDEREPLSARQRDFVQTVRASGEHLLALVNDLLDLSRIESGKLMPRLADIDLGPQFARCAELLRVSAERRGIVLHEPVGGCPRVRADPVWLKQILLNFLSNAVKYNCDHGEIRTRCEAAGGGIVRISVSDTGAGIPLERQKELFEAFNRLGAERSQTEGAGIGLFVARRLAEAMGGRVGVSSEVGRGATFWVDLPQAEAVPPGH